MLDDFTLQHLAAWIERTVYPDERERVESAMLSLLADDPTLADLSWTVVRRLAETR